MKNKALLKLKKKYNEMRSRKMTPWKTFILDPMSLEYSGAQIKEDVMVIKYTMNYYEL